MDKESAKNLVKEYIDDLQGNYIKIGRVHPYSERTIEAYTETIGNMLKSDLPPEEYGKQYCLGKKPATRHVFISRARQFYEWMIKQGQYKINPFTDWKSPKIPFEQRETFDLKQMDKLSKIVMSADQRLMFDIIMDTGCRGHELQLITMDDISPLDEQKVPSIRLTAKGNKYIYPPIRPETLGAIWQSFNAKPRKYLFQSPHKAGYPISRMEIWRKVKEIYMAAGVYKVGMGWHTMRRSYITEAIREGVPLPLVQKVVGHESYQTTARYIHWAQTDLERLHNHALFQMRDKRFRGGGIANDLEQGNETTE